MCDLCGCKQVKKLGSEAIFNRTTEIIEKLKLTLENLSLYEDCEIICYLISSKMSENIADKDFLKTVKWVNDLHGEIYDVFYKKYVQAAKDMFVKIPVKGNPKEMLTAYHQLEQLSKEIPESMINSSKESTRKVIEAIRNVHFTMTEDISRITKHYALNEF